MGCKGGNIKNLVVAPRCPEEVSFIYFIYIYIFSEASLRREPSVIDFVFLTFPKIYSRFQVSGCGRKRKLFLVKHSDVRSEETYQFQESEYKGIPMGQKEPRAVVGMKESFEGQESPL